MRAAGPGAEGKILLVVDLHIGPRPHSKGLSYVSHLLSHLPQNFQEPQGDFVCQGQHFIAIAHHCVSIINN